MRFFGGKVSVGIALALVLLSILLGLKVLPPELIAFAAPNTARPWTALLFPFAADIIVALIMAMSIGSLGSAIEREIGAAKTAVFYGTIALLSALLTQVGAMILSTQAILAGPWMLVAGLSVVYGTRYPFTKVSLLGIVTMEARWLAIGSLVLSLAAVIPMQVAIFTVFALAFPWAFAAGKLPFFPYGQPLESLRRKPYAGRGVQPPRADYFDDVKRREEEREERERLRKLFEGSANENER